MAKGKKKSSGISLEVEEQVISLSPTDLAVEVTFERNAIEALKNQRKNDHQIQELEEKIKGFQKTLDSEPEVIFAKEALDKAKADSMTEEHLDAKEDLSALKKGWNEDIKNRSQKLKYMEKMLKRHIESGALKRK